MSRSQNHAAHPDNSQVWIVGGGIASLAAAVFLATDARVPPAHIHLLEAHPQPGGAITSFGNATSGYVVREGPQISFRDVCTAKLLAMIPSVGDRDRTLWDESLDLNIKLQTVKKPATRILTQGPSGPQRLGTLNFGLAVRDRLDLVRIMLESEDQIATKTIADVFDPAFFSTKFWIIWATTFLFRPTNSALEFRRHLRQYLHEIVSQERADTQNRIRYTQHESIIGPIVQFLRDQGVDFRLNETVTDIALESADNSLARVSRITYLTADGLELHVTVNPEDLTFITLGSTSSASVMGTNTLHAQVPPAVSPHQIWLLWHNLAQKSAVFGNPANFISHTEESVVQVFTVTMRDPGFFNSIRELTQNEPGTQPVLSLAGTSWLISLHIPEQPVFSEQPADVQVFWGWAVHPDVLGDHVQKPMLACSGEEIMRELLHHLHIPLEPSLGQSVTIPCIIPLSTAPLLNCPRSDRPAVIPEGTANLALLGQFVEIADEAVLTPEHNVRGALMAVNCLLRRRHDLPLPQKDHIFEFLELLS